MKKKFFAALAALSICCCMGGLSASAITADDVAGRARELGWPEEYIQHGYAMWSSGQYTQADLQTAYNSLDKYPGAVDDKIDNLFDDDDTSTPSATEAPAPSTTTPAAPSATEAAPSGGSSGTQGGSTGTTEQGGSSGSQGGSDAKPSGGQTVTKKDGTVEDRISPADFIGMTLEEKQAYANSLTPESKRAFLDSLSAEERNSIIKQMPMDDKADIMQVYIDTAKEMGVNITVDSVSEDNISLTVRDDDGKVIDKAAVGISIDETGISHTKPLLFALGGSVLAVLGFGGLYYYIRKTEE